MMMHLPKARENVVKMGGQSGVLTVETVNGRARSKEPWDLPNTRVDLVQSDRPQDFKAARQTVSWGDIPGMSYVPVTLRSAGNETLPSNYVTQSQNS